MPWSRLRAEAGDFWFWWTGELWACLPTALRTALIPGRPLLAVDPSSGIVVFHPAGGGEAEPLGQLPLEAEQAALRSALSRLLNGRSKRRLGLAFTLRNVLTREIELPAMPSADLEAALKLDMDRRMPFTADEVLFAHRVISRDPDRGTVTVALSAAPKTITDEPRMLADRLGLPIAYLGPEKATPWTTTLLPAPPAREVRLARRMLVVGLMLLSLAALWLPLERDRREVAAVAARLAEAKVMEATLRVERDRHAGFLAAAEAVSGLEPAALPLLADIAAAWPEDARLDRLDWRDGRVELAGQTTSSSGIVARLAALPSIERVDYLSPVTRDRDGLERISLALELSREDDR
jgi:general secretion pathway protein L